MLVLATRNEGKKREILKLLENLSLTVKSLKDFPEIGEIPETGKTFEENARIKAQTVHAITGGFVLSDDSGLECEDLENRPGVDSAYFAGPHATDEENNQKLVSEMMKAHDPCRTARYICVMILIDPTGTEHIFRATCKGLITLTPSGTGGFGYDPYFFLPNQGCTMAEIPLEEKNKISHRGKVLKQVMNFLQSLFQVKSPLN